jgi:RNA polymerase sigma-70 factor (ECF subfamily)
VRLSSIPIPDAMRWGRDKRSRPLSRDSEAFRTTILPHVDAAYNLARYLVRDPSMCDEIVQDSFERAIKAFSGYQGGSPRAWLLAIVRNRCRTELLSKKRFDVRIVHNERMADGDGFEIAEVADPGDSPEESLIRSQGIQHIRDQIDALPEPFREALVLRELEELSYKEIAQVTGVALGTVMSRLSRARSLLAEALFVSDPAAGEAARKAVDEQLR